MRAAWVAIALLSGLVAACGDATPTTPTSGTRQYQQTPTTYPSGFATTVPTPSPSYTPGPYGSSNPSNPSNPYNPGPRPTATPMAVGTPAPAPTPDPLAGTGVTAAIRDQQHTGWIFHHLQISVEVVNHDPTSHSGFLVATFTLPNGSTQLAYQDLSLNPGDAQMVTLTSDGNAQSAVVTFRQTML